MLMYIQMEMYGKGIDRCTLDSGKWNVIEVLEKRLFVLIPESFMLYTLS